MSADKIEALVTDLAFWRTAGVSLLSLEPSSAGSPRIEFKGKTGPVIEFREIPHSSDYELWLRAAVEPEYQEAARKLNEAIQGVKDARAAIVARKARELSEAVRGDLVRAVSG